MIAAEHLRAWWSHRQGLDGRLKGTAPGAVLEQTGWARSLGGSSPYLTLYARASTSREATDAAIAKLEMLELPSARGCTYVVPKSDFTLALTLSQGFGDGEIKVALKLGVTEKEIDKLCDAVVNALGKQPMAPDEIREATGKASRSLGEEGKKKGLTTTLPLALGKLQELGEIRRVTDRLDQKQLRYVLWRPNPLAKSKMSAEEAGAQLARRYFQWIGPATLAEFQWFSGFNGKAVKAATEELRLQPIEPGSERLMLPGDLDKFRAFQIPKSAQYTLVSSLDAIALLRRDVSTLLDPADAGQAIATKGSKPGTGLQDLPHHAILDRGRVVGLWEYDPEAGAIAWAAYGKRNREMEKAVSDTEEFVRTQLGDVRIGSLDSPKSRAPRIEALRKAAGQR